MTPDPPIDWAEVERLFDAVVDLPPDAAAAWLASHAAGRPDVRAEVTALLAAHRRPELLLPPSDEPRPRPPGIGDIVGAYRLVEAVGRGGMSFVYSGQRVDGAFTHPVAVKIGLRPMADPVAARRVQAEREILAALRHPHIVSLLDAGVTGAGFPYLVMEYIEGVPLTAFCRDRALSLDARIDLFRQVCAAVQHAHRHAVVHRDLKPDNILVTSDGVAKVLDFGIARLLAVDTARPGATLTQEGTGPLTPNYASPEQVRGVPLTTSSDIYTLGVLLYEVLTGGRPYEVEGRPLDEILRLVAERNPDRPSTRAAGAGVPYNLRRTLAGDLDAIILCAMAKEPERRYSSADDLAADLRRHLASLPIAAREPTLGYVVRRLARRHATAAALAVLATVAVLASLGVALWQQQQADRARVVAETRARDLRQLAGTLIFTLDDVVRTNGPTEARKVIVSEALKYLDALAATSAEPTLALELAEGYLRVGDIQGNQATANLGDREGAAASARRALALAEPLAEQAALRTRALGSIVRAHRLLAMVLPKPASVEAGRRAVASAERWRQFDASDAARGALAAANFNLAAQLSGPEGRPYWEAAGAEYEALLAEDPGNLVRMRNVALVDKYLTSLVAAQGEPAEARRRAERAARLDTVRLGQQPDDPQTQVDAAISLAQLAAYVPLAEQPPLLERSVTLRERVHRQDPANEFAAAAFRRSWVPLARARLDAGDLAGARAALDRARTAYAAVESRGISAVERYWRGRVFLLTAELAQRERNRTASCRWLRRAQVEFTQVDETVLDLDRYRDTVRRQLSDCAAGE